MGLSHFPAEKKTDRKGSKRNNESKREARRKCNKSREISLVSLSNVGALTWRA